MNNPARRPLFAELGDQMGALGAELREMAAARWELARLELLADFHAAKRLAIAWLVAAVLALTALPLLAGSLAEALDGRAGIHRGHWLLIIAAALLLLALAGSYLAWRRFSRRFTGLRETLEELREDLVWLREDRRQKKGEGRGEKGEEGIGHQTTC